MREGPGCGARVSLGTVDSGTKRFPSSLVSHTVRHWCCRSEPTCARTRSGARVRTPRSLRELAARGTFLSPRRVRGMARRFRVLGRHSSPSVVVAKERLEEGCTGSTSFACGHGTRHPRPTAGGRVRSYLRGARGPKRPPWAARHA